LTGIDVSDNNHDQPGHVPAAVRLRPGAQHFRADATFSPVAGFADSSWTSFRSYSHPDRYIRHSNYVLRIDPITAGSSTTDKQDATFRVGY
jgi:hypothetical protein